MARNRNHEQPKPVQKISLSEKFPKGRLAVVILLAVIGAASFAYAIAAHLHVDAGWQAVTPPSSAETNCSSAFAFQYNIGAGNQAATAENKALAALYTELTVHAYQTFHNFETFEGVHNLYYINQHPNEVIEVDSVLYHAFETLQHCNSRWLYFAPVYAEYENLFSCKDDSETISYDPYQNKEVADYFAEIAGFANDASKIDLKLLKDNRIQLFISDDYLAYAANIGFTRFIDFFSLENAFIIDYLADELIRHGYTLGYLTSYDGFTRILDNSSTVYPYRLYDRNGQHVYPAALMQTTGAISIVSLRNYMLNAMDKLRYYELSNGDIRFPYPDGTDGLCKSAVDTLTCYASDSGCAEIALQMMPVYTSETLQITMLRQLRSKGISSIYGQDTVLYHNDPSLVLTDLYEKNGITYHSVLQ